MSARLVTAKDVAALLHMDLSTVRRKTRRSEIPGAINLGTPQRPIWRYDQAALDRWVEHSRTA